MDEFLILLQAKLDEAKSKENLNGANGDIAKLQNQLDTLKVQVKLDPKAAQKLADDIGKLINQKITISNIAVNQSNLSKTGQQIGQIISNSAEKAIGDVTSKVIGKGFTVSPAMSKKVQSELESIVKDWTNNKGKVNSITIDTKTDFIEQTLENIEQLRSATVQYSNELGQVITKTLKYKQIGVNTFANGETEVIKGWVESASTYKATLESTSKSTNNFVAQQKKAVTDLTNQVNQIYKSAIDQNAAKPIKDSTNLSNLENKYNDIVTAISKMGSASEAAFTDEKNSVNTLISDLKIVVKEYKNAETAATSMRSKDVGTIKSVKTNELDEFIAKIQNSKVPMKEMRSEIANLKTSLSDIHDTDSLTAYLNQFDIANSKFKSLKEQFAKSDSISSVIFNPVDLEKQGKVYIQKVRNTIEAIKPELESKLRKAGYSDIEIKGVEDANGKIKSLTATVTDAAGAFKQLNFERAKIQGNGKAQTGFIQTDDVKVIGSISSEISKVQNNLSTLKTKWEDQGVLVDEFKNKVEQLEISLTSVGNKGELNGLKTQIQELKSEASTLDRIREIQLSMDNGKGASEYQNRINAITVSLEKYGIESQEAQKITASLQSTFDSMKGLSGQELVTQADKLEQEFKSVKVSVDQAKLSYDKLMQPASKEKISSTLLKVQKLLNNNTKVTENVKNEWQGYVNRLSSGSDIAVKEINDINIRLKQTESAMRSVGKLGLSWTDKLKQAWEKFGGWGFATGTMMTLYNQIRKIPKEVYEIDTAMTNLYKVTDETSQKYNQFLESSSRSAQELGRSISSLVEQTANWAKLGFSIDEAEQLAKISSIYANVGEVDNDTAVSDMVTAMKAFNIEASDSITIVDKLNKLGNEYATSAAALGDGLSRSASAMATAGTDINKTLAMLTGGTEITQNASEFGNFLKIGSMRIRGMKGQLEQLGEEVDETVDSISKVQTQILNRTGGKVNIFDDMDNFRDYYDIMKDIAEIYDDLSSTNQADLTEILFGKQRGNQGAALIQAFQSGQIQKALEATLNAEGSAMEEQERWLESLEAKTQQFEAAFQSLSSTVLDSGLLKWFVDFGTGTVKVLDTVIDKLGTLGTIGTIGGAIAGAKELG